MTAHRSSLSLAALLACAACLGADGPPPDPHDGNVTRLEFVALEKPSQPRLRLSPGYGIGFPDMDAIDDYVDWINDTFDASVDDMDRYDAYRLGLEYRIAENWYAGLSYERIEASADGKVRLPAPPRDFSIDLRVDGAELSLRRVWPEALGPLDVEGVLGAGYYRSRFTEEENGYRVSGDDEAVGLRGGLALTWRLTDALDLHAHADYRLLEFERYQHSGHTVRFVSPGKPAAEADFSGFVLGAGLAWRF